MGSAILHDSRLDRRDRTRLHVDSPRARAGNAPRHRADPIERDGTQRVDAFRLGAAVFGLGVYVGVPLAGVAWLVHTFASRIAGG